MASHQPITRGCRLMVIRAPEVAGTAQPGQFVHLRCGSGTAPLLRRPISLHRVDPHQGTISLLYEVKGQGTAWLAGRVPGEAVNIIGPLGRGFSLTPADQRIVLAAGGVGIAPLFFLAERALQEGRQVKVLLGGRNREMLLAEGELRLLGIPVETATDDGSCGWHGYVTDLLASCLAGAPVDRVCACGPRPMLTAVSRLAERHGIPCLVSLEEFMACGVGACRGCVVPTRNAQGTLDYQNVCSHGPVFDVREVIL